MTIMDDVKEAIAKKLREAKDEAKVAARPLEEGKKPTPKVKEFIESPSGPSKEKLKCVKEIGEILAKYNNQEGNIPQNKKHPDYRYWDLVNKYRSL